MDQNVECRMIEMLMRICIYLQFIELQAAVIKCAVELIKMSSPPLCVAIEDRLNIQLVFLLSSIWRDLAGWLAARCSPGSELGKQSWNR